MTAPLSHHPVRGSVPGSSTSWVHESRGTLSRSKQATVSIHLSLADHSCATNSLNFQPPATHPVELRFVRLDQLTGELAPAGGHPCWAKKEKPGFSTPAFVFKNNI